MRMTSMPRARSADRLHCDEGTRLGSSSSSSGQVMQMTPQQPDDESSTRRR